MIAAICFGLAVFVIMGLLIFVIWDTISEGEYALAIFYIVVLLAAIGLISLAFGL